MIISKILKPKWQHRKSEIRKQALIEMSATDPDFSRAVTTLAQSDSDPEIRTLAIKRSGNNIKLFESILDAEKDNDVLQATYQRILSLIISSSDSISIEQRKMLLAKIDNSSIIEQIAIKADNSELRKRALERVSKPSVIEQAVIDDPEIENKTVALARIEDIHALERIIKKCRTKNKKITRLAKEKFQQKIDEIERPKEIERQTSIICSSLETLCSQGYTPKLKYETERLKHRWSDFSNEVSQETKLHYQKMIDQIDAILEEHRQSEEKRQKEEAAQKELVSAKTRLCEEVEQKAGNIESIDPESTEKEIIKQYLTDIDSQWSQLDALPLLEEQRLEKRFRKACRSIERIIISLDEYPALLKQIEELTTKCSQMIEQESMLSTRKVKEIEKSIRNICLPSHVNQHIDSLDILNQKLEKLLKRLSEEEQKEKQNQKEIPDILTKIEKYLEKGEYNHARNDMKRAKKLLSNLSRKDQNLQHKFNRLQNQLHELQDWQGFATTPKKESLCQEMEKLVESEINPEEKARQIQKLQQEWKSLGAADPKVSKKLWERFRQSSEKAYEPCKKHYEKLAQERRENLQKRESICAELENYLVQTDWENPDWKNVDKHFHSLRNKWRDCGPTDRKPGKIISDRFHSICARIQDKLNAFRSENKEAKEALIEKVERAIELEDVFEAVEIAKKAQTSWKECGPTDRKVEQSLWSVFRKACDEIFEKRQVVFDSQNSERQENLDRKNELCDQLEALLKTEDIEIAKLRSDFKTLQNQWNEIGQVPQKSLKSIKERFDKVSKSFDNNIRQRLKKLEQEKIRAIEEKSRICDEIEHHILSKGSLTEEEISLLKSRWSALPQGPKDLEDAVSQRFENSLAINEKQNDDLLKSMTSDNLLTKKELCLRIEILANIDSPPEYTQERMAYQVSRLEEGMKNTNPDPSYEFANIEREWYRIGPIPPEELPQLNQRFENARQAARQQIR